MESHVKTIHVSEAKKNDSNHSPQPDGFAAAGLGRYGAN